MVIAAWISAGALIVVIVLLYDIHRAIAATCTVLLDVRDQNRQLLIELQQIRGATESGTDSVRELS